ncbi:hypothetical protein GMA5_6 [Gordonia phage GMA5]|uniref:Uncharacterized protein n=1 Tax=Gordonia phage GMA5 TaxID=1647472 RepID=A0A0K0MWW4_9CAUD|nr:major head protein [Gordonia phage GMA5]AKI28620.1 hypothetical protein GMA5_6 [Gordonia phage GMA5]
MAHRLTPEESPTQCQHPQRAVARSSIASAVGIIPILWPLLNRELGPIWASVAVCAAVAGNALVTRVLAIPGVEAWLRDAIPGLAAATAVDTPSSGRHARLDLSAADSVHASFADTVAEVSPTERTVSGLVLPWDKLGSTTLGPLTIRPGGTRLPIDLSRCKLHFKHSGTEGHRPVGYATAYEVRPDGLHMSFAFAATPDADNAIAQVAGRVFDGFSAELAQIRREGNSVFDSIMTGVALVDTPAFADARVAELHAQHTNQEDTTMNVAAYIRDLIASGVAEADARARAVAHFGQAAVDALTADDLSFVAVDAATPPAAPAAPAAAAAPAAESAAASYTPVAPLVVPAGLPAAPTAQTTVHLSARDAAETLARMVAGRRGEVAHAQLADITASGLIDATPPAWLGELWSGPAKTRELIPLLKRRPLTSWRMQGFRWKDKPLVASYEGDKKEIPTNPVSVEPYEFEAVRWAGGHDLDRKFYDFGDSSILEAYWAAMHESYAVVTDQAAGAFLTANAKTVAPLAAVGEIPALILAMYQAKNSVKKATGVAPAYYLANSADQLSLLLLTAQNKPAFWDELGVSPSQILWRDQVPAGTLIAGAQPATTFWELGGSPLRVEAEHLSHGGRDRAMFGYTGQSIDNPDGLVKIQFTAPAGG